MYVRVSWPIVTAVITFLVFSLHRKKLKKKIRIIINVVKESQEGVKLQRTMKQNSKFDHFRKSDMKKKQIRYN